MSSSQPRRSDNTLTSSEPQGTDSGANPGATGRSRGKGTRKRDLHWCIQRCIVAACGLLVGMLLARTLGL
ncbi:MAG: hypothetical protein O2855_04900 [Planctomycetota bacterium]|nr:hypothetical protein [Planctomycetota bacterium]